MKLFNWLKGQLDKITCGDIADAPTISGLIMEHIKSHEQRYHYTDKPLYGPSIKEQMDERKKEE